MQNLKGYFNLTNFEKKDMPITLDQSGMIVISDPELLELVSGGEGSGGGDSSDRGNGMCGGTGGVNVFCPGGGSNAYCGGGGGGGGGSPPQPKPPKGPK